MLDLPLVSGVAWEALVVTQFLVGVALVALAGWLLYREPTSRIRRALALFLVLRAFIIITSQMTRVDGADPAFWSNVRGYLNVAQVPALLNFFVVYNWRARSTRVTAARWTLLGATFVLEVAYLMDHRLLYYFDADGMLLWGPMGFLIGGVFALGALLAIWFAVAADRTSAPAQTRFHRLLAIGFASFALADGILPWVFVPQLGFGRLFPEGYEPLVVLGRIAFLAAAPLALAAFALLLTQALRAPASRARAWWVAGIGLYSSVLPVTGMLWAGPVPDLAPMDPAAYAFHFILGSVRLVFPAIVVYAVARHTLSTTDPFELDYRLKITIQRSTLGAIVLAVFFVLAEGLQDVFGNAPVVQDLGPMWSRAVALVGVGALLVVFHPLQRMAERVSSSALPDARRLKDIEDPEREQIYAEQATIAWSDGNLTRKERILLDRLRERLEIPVQTAARLESQAVGSL